MTDVCHICYTGSMTDLWRAPVYMTEDERQEVYLPLVAALRLRGTTWSAWVRAIATLALNGEKQLLDVRERQERKR